MRVIIYRMWQICSMLGFDTLMFAVIETLSFGADRLCRVVDVHFMRSV